MKQITLRQVPRHFPVYLLVLPALALILLFSYFPASSAIYHAFFKWDGDEVEKYVGLKNFFRAWQDPTLAKAFGTVLIFIAANFVKMIPSIAVAVIIHRIVSDRARYFYRVAFVVPMIIPGMVWLLLWKFFYDPNIGVLNGILNGTGTMSVLQWLDEAMPTFAAKVAPIYSGVIDPVFGSIWGMGMTAILLLKVRRDVLPPKHFAAADSRMVDQKDSRWNWIGRKIFLLAAVYVVYGLYTQIMDVSDGILGGSIWTHVAIWAVPVTVGIVVIQSVVQRFAPTIYRRLARDWLLWVMILVAGYGIYGSLLRLVLTLAAVIVFSRIFYPRQRYNRDIPGRTALVMLIVTVALILLTRTWTEPTNAFDTDSPAWLGHKDLILPALVFWGFPWVGIVGVLLYLSGLGNIDQSVYEASEIDGCGWFRKFWSIELPLIMTQVRLNLVLMIIGTMKGWGQVFIICGDSGGPDGRAMLPGLYMFRKAFTDGEAGYACGVGLILFVLILVLTIINNRYVRVDK